KVLPPLPLKSEPGNPDALTGDFYPSGAGKYVVSAAVSEGGKVLVNRQDEFRVQGRDLELSNTATRPDNLEVRATATGGFALDAGEAEKLAPYLSKGEDRPATPHTERKPYWDSPWLFGAFLLAVTGEWFLRRRNHLV